MNTVLLHSIVHRLVYMNRVLIAFHSTSVGLNEYGAIAFHSISVGLNASLYIDLMYSKLVVCTPLNHTLPIIIAVRNDCQMNC